MQRMRHRSVPRPPRSPATRPIDLLMTTSSPVVSNIPMMGTGRGSSQQGDGCASNSAMDGCEALLTTRAKGSSCEALLLSCPTTQCALVSLPEDENPMTSHETRSCQDWMRGIIKLGDCDPASLRGPIGDEDRRGPGGLEAWRVFERPLGPTQQLAAHCFLCLKRRTQSRVTRRGALSRLDARDSGGAARPMAGRTIRRGVLNRSRTAGRIIAS